MSPAPALSSPSKIIIHHSACGDTSSLEWNAIRRWHIDHNGWDDIGYHQGIELIGTTYESIFGRPWDHVGAHTIGQNGVSLGLCLIGNFSLAEPPRAQLIAAAAFVSFWMRHYQIPLTEIWPHSHFNATECPGTKFPWDNFIDLVKVASA
jgi:hypothetical protein